MMEEYKNAMSRIKTDDAYKAEFLDKIQKKSEKKTNVRFLPVLSYLSTAAAVLFVVSCTIMFFIKQPDDASLKMKGETEGISVTSSKTRDANNVIYFTFDGFEQYDMDVQSRAVLINSFEEDYTVANLLSDYYPLIVGENEGLQISDGMIDNFCNVSADSEKEINVYVNDREVLNLDRELISECIEAEQDVHFKVTVEN